MVGEIYLLNDLLKISVSFSSSSSNLAATASSVTLLMIEELLEECLDCHLKVSCTVNITDLSIFSSQVPYTKKAKEKDRRKKLTDMICYLFEKATTGMLVSGVPSKTGNIQSYMLHYLNSYRPLGQQYSPPSPIPPSPHPTPTSTPHPPTPTPPPPMSNVPNLSDHKTMIILDDAQWIDKDSWVVLYDIIKRTRVKNLNFGLHILVGRSSPAESLDPCLKRGYG